MRWEISEQQNEFDMANFMMYYWYIQKMESAEAMFLDRGERHVWESNVSFELLFVVLKDKKYPY